MLSPYIFVLRLYMTIIHWVKDINSLPEFRKDFKSDSGSWKIDSEVF